MQIVEDLKKALDFKVQILKLNIMLSKLLFKDHWLKKLIFMVRQLIYLIEKKIHVLFFVQ